MSYIDIGQGDPLVMVHGFSLCAYTWRNNVHALLDAGFRLILIEMPGHGQSDIPSSSYPFTVEQIAHDIVTLTRGIGLESFHLIGHSLGAGLALFISTHYAQSVRNAVVVAPPAFGPPRRLLLTYPGMTALASVFFGRWTVKANMKAMYYDDDLIDAEIIDEYALQINKDGYWNMLGALSRQYFSPQFDEMQSAYPSISMPLLIIWGEQEEWLPVDMAHKLHERIPHSQLLVVPNSGHNPHEECAERVNPIVVEFLKEAPTIHL